MQSRTVCWPFSRHFGERLEDVAVAVALDILQCIHVWLANFVTPEDEHAPVSPAEVAEVLGEAPYQAACAQDVKKVFVHRKFHVQALMYGIDKSAQVIDSCSSPLQRHGQARAPHARLIRGHSLHAILEKIASA